MQPTEPADEGPDLSGLPEESLATAVANGEQAAVDELFVRHWTPALAVGIRLAGPTDAEDLVSEAFAKVLGMMARGKGPQGEFLPYLLTTMRTLQIDRYRENRTLPVADFVGESFEPTYTDDSLARVDAAMVARAFEGLPERWRVVLWHTAVEGEPLAKVSERLDMKANAVAALAFRAREGLRTAFLAEHLAENDKPRCRETHELLARYARGDLRHQHTVRVERHLSTCADCRAALHELLEVDSRMGAAVVPALAGMPALAGNGVVTVGAAGAAGTVVGGVATGTWKKVGIAVLVGLGLTVAGTQVLGDDGPPSSTPVVSPSRTPEPTPSVSASVSPSAATSPPAAATPTPAPVPTPSAVATATPTPTPPTSSAPAPPVVEPSPVTMALAPAYVEEMVPPPDQWSHVEFRIDASAPDGDRLGRADLTMDVRLTGVREHLVHADGRFGAWTCQPRGGGNGQGLTCRLPRRSQGHGLTLALDLAPSGGRPMRAVASLAVDGDAEVSASHRRVDVQIPVGRG